MSIRTRPIWPAWIVSIGVLVACSSSDDTGGGKQPAGNAGQVGDAGGAPSNGGQGGSSGAFTQGGASGAGAASGQNCGLEICSGTKQCCPSTGKCFDPSFEGCGKITCKITSNDTGGAAGAANCCPMSLSHCAANNLCYHAACVGCCP
jgi:hypothetical protein